MGQTASRIRQSVAVVLFVAGLYGEVRLPAILGDHMVVQAGVPVRLWGWAGVDEVVTAQIGAGAAVMTKANGAGKWQVFLPKLAFKCCPAPANSDRLTPVPLFKLIVLFRNTAVIVLLGVVGFTRRMPSPPLS